MTLRRVSCKSLTTNQSKRPTGDNDDLGGCMCVYGVTLKNGLIKNTSSILSGIEITLVN